MISSVEIQNFKGFRQLELRDLPMVNVLVGPSGSGKTAFMEALFMCSGVVPDFFARVQGWRGSLNTPNQGMPLDPDNYVGLFREMFFSGARPANVEPIHSTPPVDIVFRDSEAGKWRLTVSIEPNESAPLLPLEQSTSESAMTGPVSESAATAPDVVFRGKGRPEKVCVVRVSPRHKNFIQLEGQPYPYGMTFLSPATLFHASGNAKRFSDLSKLNQEGRVASALGRFVHGLQSLSIVGDGGGNVIVAQLEGVSQKLPVGSLSGGMHKFLGILLGIASRPKGALLIDEIENGIYFKTLPAMLRTIVEEAKINHTQLFLTTHSNECLQALAPLIKEDPESFRLLKSEKDETTGECSIAWFEGDVIEAATAQGVELR